MITKPKPKTPTTKSVRGRRTGAETRQAILDAARRKFTIYGYDGVGVRDIAHKAGVTAVMVYRYFGSKEKLFEEVVECMLSPGAVVTKDQIGGDAATLSHDIVASLVAGTTPDKIVEGFLILIRSAPSEQAAKILREKFTTHRSTPMMARMTGSEVQARCAIIMSIIAGLPLMRQIVKLPVAAESDEQELIHNLEPVFDFLINGGELAVRPTGGRHG